mmetsp:Transcript_100701/g.291053  ORF Transcript_100701/g.291053 Transcript_100701/m.291053 type:complete len:237 (-) Transcript_100701:498-1208(-)
MRGRPTTVSGCPWATPSRTGCAASPSSRRARCWGTAPRSTSCSWAGGAPCICVAAHWRCARTSSSPFSARAGRSSSSPAPPKDPWLAAYRRGRRGTSTPAATRRGAPRPHRPHRSAAARRRRRRCSGTGARPSTASGSPPSTSASSRNGSATSASSMASPPWATARRSSSCSGAWAAPCSCVAESWPSSLAACGASARTAELWNSSPWTVAGIAPARIGCRSPRARGLAPAGRRRT